MRNTLLAIGATVLVVFGAWYLSFYKPLKIRMTQTQKQIRVEEKKLATYQTALREIESKCREYDSLRSALGIEDISFSGEDEVILLYKTLDSLCNRPDYTLEEITPSLEEVIQFLRKWESAEARVYIPINIKIKANYTSLVKLVSELEKSTYFDHLEQTRIVGEDELYPVCRMEIGFVAGLNNRLGMLTIE